MLDSRFLALTLALLFPAAAGRPARLKIPECHKCRMQGGIIKIGQNVAPVRGYLMVIRWLYC